MKTSINEIWSRIAGSLPKDAMVRVLGDCIIEVVREDRYIRAVLSEDDRVDKPFLLAVYTRDRLPKTAFYTDPWSPKTCSANEVCEAIVKM